jgi:CheY-like chemotaxis protein
MKAKRHVILVVEDSPEDRYSYRRMIESGGGAEGYSVLEAEDAAAGLALLRSVAVDCVGLDYNLPDLDGLEFLANVAQEPEIK